MVGLGTRLGGGGGGGGGIKVDISCPITHESNGRTSTLGWTVIQIIRRQRMAPYSENTSNILFPFQPGYENYA